MAPPQTVIDGQTLQRTLARIAHEIVERNPAPEKLALLGLPTRGFPLAQRLAALLLELTHVVVPTGQLDITFHRDDLDRHVPLPQSTRIDFDLKDRVVLLVDDVLFTGRSVRAALAALNDFGRPAEIQLVALVDRGHRQLPIRADYVGKNIPTKVNDEVVVRLKEIDGEDVVRVVHQ